MLHHGILIDYTYMIHKVNVFYMHIDNEPLCIQKAEGIARLLQRQLVLGARPFLEVRSESSKFGF